MVAAVGFDYLAVVAVSDGLLEKDKNGIIKAFCHCYVVGFCFYYGSF